MYRVAALYVVERYKPHVLEDVRRALRRARIAQVSWLGHLSEPCCSTLATGHTEFLT